MPTNDTMHKHQQKLANVTLRFNVSPSKHTWC